jgi:hypothetical protein
LIVASNTGFPSTSERSASRARIPRARDAPVSSGASIRASRTFSPRRRVCIPKSMSTVQVSPSNTPVTTA